MLKTFIYTFLPPPSPNISLFPSTLSTCARIAHFPPRLDKSTLNCRLAIGQPFTSATEHRHPTNGLPVLSIQDRADCSSTTATGALCEWNK